MHDLTLLSTIAMGFAAAWVFGLITQALKLSPIVGYLLAGIAIGPYTPGFVGDIGIANQLAEVGVILLMFGVGLHFHIKDLLAEKRIAIPVAVGQSAIATLVAIAAFHFFDWPVKSSFVVGMAMAVASTVVLMRVLMDRDMLNTVHGHVAVGWLIVEDIFTVLMLVLVPMLAGGAGGSENSAEHAATVGWASLGWALLKLVALVLIVMLAGSRLVPWILTQVARLRSRELFTLTVLVLSITVAVGSAELFGASVALGAFLAGMVVGQSPVSHQAAADALPLRDAFSVLFFVAVGMLFDPMFLVHEPIMVAVAMGIVLLIKPLSALFIVSILGYSSRTALTVAIGLAQIGEFSFILSQVARHHNLIPEQGHHMLVAVSILSITINPILFGRLNGLERWLQNRPSLWNLLNARAAKHLDRINLSAQERIAKTQQPIAIIVGYGPVGRLVDALLRESGMETVIVEMNMDTVQSLTKSGRIAVFGDGTRREILLHSKIALAEHLVIALPHSANLDPLVLAARELNPNVEVTVRARYLRDRERLEAAGASKVVLEEGEVGAALARHVMERRGMDQRTIEKMMGALRKLWRMDGDPRR